MKGRWFGRRLEDGPLFFKADRRIAGYNAVPQEEKRRRRLEPACIRPDRLDGIGLLPTILALFLSLSSIEENACAVDGIGGGASPFRMYNGRAGADEGAHVL